LHSLTSEQQVVYILVEMRKLLEPNNDKDRFPALNFYCDCAAHPAFDRVGVCR